MSRLPLFIKCSPSSQGSVFKRQVQVKRVHQPLRIRSFSRKLSNPPDFIDRFLESLPSFAMFLSLFFVRHSDSFRHLWLVQKNTSTISIFVPRSLLVDGKQWAITSLHQSKMVRFCDKHSIHSVLVRSLLVSQFLLPPQWLRFYRLAQSFVSQVPFFEVSIFVRWSRPLFRFPTFFDRPTRESSLNASPRSFPISLPSLAFPLVHSLARRTLPPYPRWFLFHNGFLVFIVSWCFVGQTGNKKHWSCVRPSLSQTGCSFRL